MNVRRGLFRTWVVASTFWIAATVIAAPVIVPQTLTGWKFQYVSITKPDIDVQKADWSRPFYELMQSPTVIGITPKFTEVATPYISDWDKRAQDGRLQIVAFADDSKLYLQSDMSKDDKEFIIQNFWAQRWTRWGWLCGEWTLIALGPVLGILVIGRALMWVAKGFAED